MHAWSSEAQLGWQQTLLLAQAPLAQSPLAPHFEPGAPNEPELLDDEDELADVPELVTVTPLELAVEAVELVELEVA